MKTRPGLPSNNMTSRARAFLNEIAFFYQAEAVEALLAPRGSRAKTSPIAALFDTVKEVPERRRRAMARRLFEVDMNTGEKLSERTAARLRKVVDPKSELPLLRRSGTSEVLYKLCPNMPKDADDPKQAWEFVREFLPEFGVITYKPRKPQNDFDGRPDDAEPENPDTDEVSNGPNYPQIGPWVPSTNPVPYTRLDFVVEEVLCLDTTNGEAGRDEISLSGFFMQYDQATNQGNATSGRVIRSVNPIFDIGQFRDGENHTNFQTPYHSFDLQGWNMPSFAEALVTMAETDPGGGFDTFMAAFASPIPPPPPNGGDAFLNAIMYSSWIGMGLGFAGAVAGVLASGAVLGIVGLIGGLAIGVLVGVIWIYNLLGGNTDEIFPPQMARLVLIPATFSGYPFYGATRSVTERLHFEVDGGAYDVFYHWELSQPSQAAGGDQD